MLAAAVLAAGIGALWLRSRLVTSLPALDGEVELGALSSAVEIERDGLGVPTVHAATRLDAARALGFLHGQERFFQMDLLRRKAAGELAAIVGPAAVDLDRRARAHRFRARAEAAVARSGPEARGIVEAYTAGVNEGLAALGDVPPEYLALRAKPEPWRPEDSTLVVMSMYLELQGYLWARESARGLIYDVLPRELADFLSPPGTAWDAPIVGLPVPGSGAAASTRGGAPGPVARGGRAVEAGAEPEAEIEAAPVAGSNNWAVAGTRARDGGALVANDMHLPLGLPNIWYRACLLIGGAQGAPPQRIAGVTLPGVPAVVAGSNGHVAWGFTNTNGDWADLIVLEPDPADPQRYLGPAGPLAFEHFEERIAVKGGADVALEVLETIWGPVVDVDHLGRPRALRWVAHLPDATDIGLLALEHARTVEEALDAAAAAGMPAQNIVVADDTGRIGWSVAGRIPVRVPGDATRPLPWREAGPPWSAWIDAAGYPRVVDPGSGRLWTANNRVVDPPLVDALGDGGYDLGARAAQIRDDLLRLDAASEADLLAIQLDDRALFLAPWRELLLDVLKRAGASADPRHAELARRIEQGWTGRASIDSVGYRLVRAWRFYLARQVFRHLAAPAVAVDKNLVWGSVTGQYEGPLWRLVTERPAQLLDPRFASWDEEILAAADVMLDELKNEQGGIDFDALTWGARNTVRVGHPLSRAVPRLARWLDIPPEPLPGDSNMPRVQTPDFGASERFVVSPGREERGIFHMPGGQSGHFLSPWYRAGHAAWAAGEATPFLPGAAQHRLTLRPRAGSRE